MTARTKSLSAGESRPRCDKLETRYLSSRQEVGEHRLRRELLESLSGTGILECRDRALSRSVRLPQPLLGDWPLTAPRSTEPSSFSGEPWCLLGLVASRRPFDSTYKLCFARGMNAPSAFWQRLAEDHSRRLDLHGLGEVKRQQALRYFTWQWRWNQLQKSEQLRFLWANTSLATKLKAATAPVSLSNAMWQGLPWSRPDCWLYAFATRLVYEYALQHGDQATLKLGEPALGNPPPVSWHGRIVSQDLANSALEMAAIHRALGTRTPNSILEIGAGYGRTAYALLGTFSDARYTIIDIEPALSLSRWYITSLFPKRDVRFLHPDEATPEVVGDCDLAVSISSLQEMTHEQIASYLALVDQTARGVVYLKQWRKWTNPDDGVTTELEEYPVPKSWQLLFLEQAPVQTAFVQAAWAAQTSDS